MKRGRAALKNRVASLRLPDALILMSRRNHWNATIEVVFLAMMQSGFFLGKIYVIPPLAGQSCSQEPCHFTPDSV